MFAAICIVVGVAAVVALQTASLTVRSALTSNVRAANGGDISVVSEESPLSATDLQVFRHLRRQGEISQWAAVYSDHATAVGPARTLVPFSVDVAPANYPIGGQPTFVSPVNGNVSRLLQGRGNVLVTSALAQELGAHLGSRIRVRGLGGPGLEATVRGILSSTSLDRSASMTVSTRDATAISTGPPQFTAVYANVSGPATRAAAAIRRAFPFATVQTVAEALKANEADVHDFQQFLLLAGLLTLLIAGIGILNAMQSTLTSRQLEIAMLKAMGYRQTALYLLFGGEALVIGLIGGILGTALGAAASEIITTAIANAVAVQVSVALDAGTLLGGIALGIVATLIFAVLPIARSASLRPLEILRHGGEARIAGRAPQTAALLGVVVILFAALASAVLGDWVLAAEFVIGAFIACAIMTGAFSLLVGWTGLLGRPPNAAFGLLILVLLLVGLTYSLRVQPAFSIILGLAALVWASTVLLPDARLLPLRIAARSLSRRRARTSVTLVAFLVGILCMTLTLTVALTLQSQISGALASANSVNMVAIGNAATANAMLHASSHLPGVRSRSAVTTLQARPTSVNGRALTSILGSAPSVSPDDAIRMLDGVTGWDLKHGHLPTSVYVTAGRDLSRRDAGTDNVLVNQELRFAPYRIAPGSTIILRDSTSGVSRQVTVVGLYSRAHGIRRRSIGSFFTQPVFGDRSLTNVLGPTDAQTIASFNVQSAQLTGDTARLQRLVPGALVINVNDLTAVVRSILNDLLNVLVVITGLAMGAGLAVVGTSVSLAMLERYREIALYKVIGFSPRSVLSFVLVENALAGTLAGGVSVGLVAAALAILSRTALQTTISFDPILAIYVVAGAMLLAIVTAYLLARGSVNVRPLDALRNE